MGAEGGPRLQAREEAMSWRDVLRAVAVVALALPTMGGNCGGSDEKDGPCVFTLREDNSVALCEDGYSADECSAFQSPLYTTAFTSGGSCAALGYTLTCGGDPQGMLRKVCPAG